MPLHSQDNTARTSSFHAKLCRLYARDIEREREVLFGADAELQLYKVTPADGRVLLGSPLLDGWTAQIFSDHWRVEVLEPDTASWETIRPAAEAQVTTHLGVQKFRVMQVQQPMVAGHAWVLRLEAMERSS